MRVGIVDYGIGNIRSLAGAIKRVGHEPFIIRASSELICEVDRLVLPGVGAFGECISSLIQDGFLELLHTEVFIRKKPILCICVGCQLLSKESNEFGTHAGLGWIDARVTRLTPSLSSFSIPHVSWNKVTQTKDSVLWRGIDPESLFYFTHSYHVICEEQDLVSGTCDYGGEFVAAFERNNIFATQFHPEKSQRAGLKLIKNFIELS